MSNIADRVRIAQDKDGMLRRALERIMQITLLLMRSLDLR